MISIIIPTFQEKDFIRDTLEQLKELATYPHEIIITDGGSTDGTLDIVREYTDKVVVWSGEGRQTFGNAKNAGAALATGDYLLFIDADVIVPNPAAFMERITKLFEKRSDVTGILVPLKVTPSFRKFFDVFFVEPLNIWYWISNNVFHFGNASGEFQMIRRSAFEKIHGYREDLVAGEDTDMFNRLGKIGRTLYYPKLFVYHSCRRARKLGWIKMYSIWTWNGLSVLIFKKAAYDEWKVIR